MNVDPNELEIAERYKLLIGTIGGTTLLGPTPTVEAIRACAENRWIATEPLLGQLLTSGALITVVFLVAVRVGRRPGR